MDPSIFGGLVPARAREELLADGVSLGELRGPRWQRTSHGRYLPSGVDAADCLQRIVDAAARLPSRGAVGGWAAARALGVDHCDGLDVDGRSLLDVPLCLGGQRIRGGGGIELWFDPLPENDVTEIDGLRFTRPTRTCLDRMRRAPDLRESVVVADQMTHARLVTVPAMTDYVGAHGGWRGIDQARRALRLCDPMSRNGWETRMRMVWMLDAGLPRPRCNPPVFDRFEGLLGYPDLLDPEAAVVFEYDGAGHRGSRQHDADNRREETLEHHGLVVARVSRADLGDRRGLTDRMQRTRRRGLRRDRAHDAWTLEVPPSWGAYGAEDDADVFWGW